MKKIDNKSKKNKTELLSDCNCLNCRLGRIENQLDSVQNMIESLAMNNNPTGNPKKKKSNNKK